MTCDRPFGHRPHAFVDDTGADQQCDGQGSSTCLAELLDKNPKVAGIGPAAARLDLEVMCA